MFAICKYEMHVHPEMVDPILHFLRCLHRFIYAPEIYEVK